MSGEMTQNGQDYAAAYASGSVTEQSILNGVSAADVGVITVMDDSPIFEDREELLHAGPGQSPWTYCGFVRKGPTPPIPPAGTPALEACCAKCVGGSAAKFGVHPTQMIVTERGTLTPRSNA